MTLTKLRKKKPLPPQVKWTCPEPNCDDFILYRQGDPNAEAEKEQHMKEAHGKTRGSRTWSSDDRNFVLELITAIRTKRHEIGLGEVSNRFDPNGYFIVIFDGVSGKSTAFAKGFVNADQIMYALEELKFDMERYKDEIQERDTGKEKQT